MAPKRKRRCEEGSKCPYKHEYQHLLEFSHGDDDDGAKSVTPHSGAVFVGKGRKLGSAKSTRGSSAVGQKIGGAFAGKGQKLGGASSKVGTHIGVSARENPPFTSRGVKLSGTPLSRFASSSSSSS